jgi:hypothetical protein
MIVNSIVVVLVCNTEFISKIDKIFWNTKIILILSGLCCAGFFFAFKFIHHLTIQKLLLIFLIIRVLLLYCFTVFEYGVEYIDYSFYYQMPPHVLNGDIFTPFTGNWEAEAWRSFPPLFIWWYTYNYWIYGAYGVNTIFVQTISRFVYLLLEVGIVYVMTQIFRENSGTEKGWNEKNFKIGLTLYIFALTPIVAILLYANIIALPVLLSLLGFLYFFRSKKNPKYLYYAVVFFSLATLTEAIAVFWLLGIALVELFRKNFRRLFLLILEMLAILCLVTLPFLLNDAIGYFQHMLSYIYKSTAGNWDGAIWAINSELFNLPSLINSIPSAIAISLLILYTYKNYKSEPSLDFFIVIVSIYLFFGPGFSAWHYLWIFSLICLNIINSVRKFLITNLFFWGYFVFYALWFASGYLTYPGGLPPPMAYSDIFGNWMVEMGYFTIYPMIVQLAYQIGFIYLIFSYSKSKKLVLALFIPFIIYYIFNICMPGNLLFGV